MQLHHLIRLHDFEIYLPKYTKNCRHRSHDNC